MDLYKELEALAEVEENIPLSKMTTLRIGGVARYVVYPENTLSLQGVMNKLNQNHIPYKVIGKGSNLLCSDEPFDGVIIRLDRYLCNAYFDNEHLVAEAGCSIIALSYEAMKNELSGLEFASGIPGTVGGVTFMNAGAYKSSMADVIDSVSVYRDGKIEWIQNADCGFSYRTSIFQKHPDWIILAVKMTLQKGDQKEIRELMDSRRERRMNSQPLDKHSAGSIFRNPEEIPAWKLIEGAGFRGKRIGDAVVSEKHVNFIVNENHASAKDFITLVTDVQKAVKDKYDIDLYMEVEKFNWR
ncbi:MAG: UDP-N-acetylmuramate dehydrogenase [Bulleidia sp.]|nr:UDP-N-acetylmuramate dehydrogenase [Erysipelotrichaceae bacterium]MDY2780303.1 UDP-N-acetylmuramate dehydrogenase [Bulleidia sp.]